MSRPRKPIQKVDEGNKNVARFVHPLFGRTVRFDLGDDTAWRTNLFSLNQIFLDETLWRNPPPGTPKAVRDQWLGDESILKYRGGKVSKGSEVTEATAPQVAKLIAKVDALTAEREELLKKIDLQAKELEHWRGRKLVKGPKKTLQDAYDDFLKNYVARDAGWKQTVRCDLTNFVKKFGPKTTVEEMEGRETEISTYIGKMVNAKGHKLSGSRRNQIRQYILRMLIEAGGKPNRSLIKRAGKAEIRDARGGIKHVSLEDAKKLAEKLSTPWREMWEIQVAIGLRPDELITLAASNFENDFSGLRLSPLEHLTLKNGTRYIPIPPSLRPLFKTRAENHPKAFFPNPKSGKIWKRPDWFNEQYRLALKAAAKEAGIHTVMDCRTGRRTCASLLVKNNVSAEKIAKLLGNTAAVILDHYGDTDVKNLDLEQNTIGVKNGN